MAFSTMAPPSALADVSLLGPSSKIDPDVSLATLQDDIQHEPYFTLVKTYDLKFGNYIGGGYYSDVFRAKIGQSADESVSRFLGDKVNTEKVIVKIVNASKCPKKENYENEMAICKIIQADPHPNIVPILQLFDFPGGKFWLLMPNAGRRLSSFLDKCSHPVGRLPEKPARSLFKQLTSALEYLHSRSIVHRDIKPENVLVTREYWSLTARLIDFGFAKVVTDRCDEAGTSGAPALCTSHKGTLEFMAPELLVPNLFYDAIKTDVYSLGMLLYFMLHGVSPYILPSNSPSRSISSLVKEYHALKQQPVKYPPLYHRDHHKYKSVSGDAQQLINGMLQPRPESRSTLAMVMEHNWVTRDQPMGFNVNGKQIEAEYPSTESF